MGMRVDLHNLVKYCSLISIAVLGLAGLQGSAAANQAGRSPKDWLEGKTYSLNRLEVNISAPVLVGRSKGYFWQPTLVRLSDDELLATIWSLNDAIHTNNTDLYSWS